MPKITIAYAKTDLVPDAEVEFEVQSIRRVGPDRIVIDRWAAQQIANLWPGASIFDTAFHLIYEATMFVECRVVKMAGDCTVECLRVSPYPPPEPPCLIIGT